MKMLCNILCNWNGGKGRKGRKWRGGKERGEEIYQGGEERDEDERKSDAIA